MSHIVELPIVSKHRDIEVLVIYIRRPLLFSAKGLYKWDYNADGIHVLWIEKSFPSAHEFTAKTNKDQPPFYIGFDIIR